MKKEAQDSKVLYELAQVKKQLDLMVASKAVGVESSSKIECQLCFLQNHTAQECYMYGGVAASGDCTQEEANYLREGGYRNPRNDPYSSTYNPGWRNHPNFRYGGGSTSQDQYQNGPPPGKQDQNSYQNPNSYEHKNGPPSGKPNQNYYGHQNGPPPGFQNNSSNFQDRGPPAPPQSAPEPSMGDMMREIR